MTKHTFSSVLLLIILAALGYFLYASETGARFGSFPFRYGLDLNGGTELIYRADTSRVESDPEGAMSTLRDVIERRVNAFGVSEAVVQVEEAGVVTGNRENRLIVELPGVTDTQKAIDIIGATPSLEFRLLPYTGAELEQRLGTSTLDEMASLFVPTGLTGSQLERAQLQFRQIGQGAAMPNEPIVALTFNGEGAELFGTITTENIGKLLGIFLDGELISSPQINVPITDGQAIIEGHFTPDEGKELVRNLNYGALPVPIELSSTQVVGATLGAEAKDQGVQAGVAAFAFVCLFLVLWYRLPGFTAVIALLLYIAITLVVYKLVPITLTAAGIAGFIISMGMAIDANVLIFERLKDELRAGKRLSEAVKEGFHRAWLPVRDANLSGLITAVILYWLGNAAVKGFAVTLGIGNIVSMFTAVTVTRTFLYALALKRDGSGNENATLRFLFGGKKS